LLAYLGLWATFGAVAALLLTLRGGVDASMAVWVAVPPAMLYGLVCLAAWYVCRAFPLEGTGTVARVLFAHVAAASLTSAVWAGFTPWWVAWWQPLRAAWSRDATLMLFGLGVLVFLLSSAVHYVVLTLEAGEAARRQALESAVLAREAELRALRAQVNPHFLFNSLHSIGALAGTRPASARDMAVGLGEFLRQSLRLGALAGVPLRQEVDLTRQYLAIEQVRFGDRLQVAVDIDASAGDALVPPLILQPLVENAIKHGVAGLLDGGQVRIAATRVGGTCTIIVRNRFDRESAPRAGTGTGLRNVRERLATHFGVVAAFDARAEGEEFIVTMSFPWAQAPASQGAAS
jgi:two-component system sensor histidine kinase AlgZ